MKTTKTQCPGVSITLAVLGGKWKPLILFHLHQGTFRFSELSKKMPGITQKMLTQELRAMEENGLVKRKVYPVVPPKVEYSLTEYGKTLEPILKSMRLWGEKHRQKVEASPAAAEIPQA
jgi:DNA-binding HxlR family transcriptional regulator